MSLLRGGTSDVTPESIHADVLDPPSRAKRDKPPRDRLEMDFREEPSDDEKKQPTCSHCRRQIDLGADALKLESGVYGPRGLVPLKPPRWFCDEHCASGYFCDEEIFQLPRRVP